MTPQFLHDAGQLMVIDIETVPQYPNFASVPPHWQQLWTEKISKLLPEGTEAADVYDTRAGILAEFGRIICISTGIFYSDKAGRICFRIKSFSNDDEQTLLSEFVAAAGAYVQQHRQVSFAGHNIREFDIPYICRRMLMNGMALPAFLDFTGKKPWEVKMVDTLQMWKFGDYKHYTSLRLLTACLNVPSPKNELDGSKVREVYYVEKNLPSIVSYCQGDVVAVANLLQRMQNLPVLPDANIFVAE